MKTASILLAIIGLLGAFDIAYFHWYKCRLSSRPESRLEVWIHVARGVIYALQFAIVPNVRFHGAFYVAFAALFAADIAVAWTDVAIEPASRRSQGGLPRGEYFMHIVLSVLVGVYLHAIAADSIAWPRRAPATDAALGALLDRNVGRLAAIGAFSGTVLVARGERVVYARGFGLAERDHAVPNGVDTRYTTASMGKMFTAVAVAQLVEAGRLRLDDTLARVLPDYPNAERAGRITIRHLLAHTAGLGDVWSHPAFVRGRGYASNRQLAWAVADAPLAFAPGTRWAYSNEGYVVLGAVVERLAGTSFEGYLRRHVWGPAGMTETANVGADAVVPHRAVGYTAGDDDPLRVEVPRPNWPFIGATSAASGAGGTYATAGDYLRFARALRRGALVRPATRDTLWAARNPLPWDAATAYGYGFERATVDGRAVVGHGGGGGMGIDNQLAFAADGAFTVVVLGNADPPAATALKAALVRMLAAR